MLLGFLVMAMVPAYVLLQPAALLRLTGGWRIAAAMPLILALPTAAWSLFALSQGSNLWPLTFILFAAIGTLYLVALLVLHQFR